MLIGLGHKGRQGKGEFAQAIVGYNRLLGKEENLEVMSFAQPLRDEVAAEARRLFYEKYENFPQSNKFSGHDAMRLVCENRGIPFEEDPVVDRLYPWGKQVALLQWWGTEFRRAQDPDYWVKKAMKGVKESRAKVIIFDDLRFENEYEALGAAGGYRIKITRLGYKSTTPGHISETALDDYPFDLQIAVRDGMLPLLQSYAIHTFRELNSNLY